MNTKNPQRNLFVLSARNEKRVILRTVISEEGRPHSRCVPVSQAEVLVDLGVILLALTKREHNLGNSKKALAPWQDVQGDADSANESGIRPGDKVVQKERRARSLARDCQGRGPVGQFCRGFFGACLSEWFVSEWFVVSRTGAA